jgi:hypothetical protein
MSVQRLPCSRAPILWVLGLCAFAWLVALSAAAQDVTPEREREARALFEAGVDAAKREEYARARELFQRSRKLVVKASTLLNLAIADFKLGLVDEALFALDAIEAPADGPEQERLRRRARSVRGEVEALRETLAREQAEQSALAAQQESDQRELAPAAPVGSAVATAPVAAAQPESSAAPTAGATGPQVAEQHASAEPPSLLAPRLLLAAGGALGAGAIGAALWWHQRSQSHDECLHAHEDMRCNEEAQIARQKSAAMGLTLTLGIAAAGLVTTGAIWLVRRKSDRRISNVSASAWGGPSAIGLLARGRF